MDWSDTGFVVAKGLFREADVWLRILFRGHGMQTVFAFGGAHSRRRFVGCLDVMNILTCRVSPSRRGTYLDLEEAVLEKGPERLRHSPALLGIAANCLKFTRAVGVPEQSGEEGFRLLSEMLARLESGDAPSVLFPLFFRLRLAGILGYAPGFDICASCGRPVEGAGISLSRRPVCSVRSARPVHGAEALFFRQKRLTSCGMYSKNILFHGLRLVFRRRTGARQPRP